MTGLILAGTAGSIALGLGLAFLFHHLAQRKPKTEKQRFDAALEDLARRTRERMSNAIN